MSEDSFDLWLKRGRCSENVWMWGIIPFLIPYAYYKVGMGWRGVGIFVAAPIVSVLFAILIGLAQEGLQYLSMDFLMHTTLPKNTTEFMQNLI